MTTRDEKLEFSAQDLGRLAYHLDALVDMVAWVISYTDDPNEIRRVIKAIKEGYEEQ